MVVFFRGFPFIPQRYPIKSYIVNVGYKGL